MPTRSSYINQERVKVEKGLSLYASAAIVSVLALAYSPSMPTALPLSKEDSEVLATANLYKPGISKLDSLRDGQKNTFDLGLHEVISAKRKLVERYQLDSIALGSEIKVSNSEYALAIEAAASYSKASLILSQNRGSEGGTGTAFLISETLALTNAHNLNALDGVVPEGLRFSLMDYDGNQYSAEVLGVDGAADLALLRLSSPAVGLPTFPIDTWELDFKKDDVVVSVGNASALGVWTPLIGKNIESYNFSGIRNGIASLNVSSGASGSPVFGLDGALRGIIYASTASNSEERIDEPSLGELNSYLELTESVFYLTSDEILKRVELWTK